MRNSSTLPAEFQFSHFKGGAKEIPRTPEYFDYTGFVLLMAAVAYFVLQHAITAMRGQQWVFAAAIRRGWKGKLSPVLYLSAIPLPFISPWISGSIYTLVALIWLIPDRRLNL